MLADPKRVQSVFALALDAGDASGRAAILDRECANDNELRRRVEGLLQAHDAPGSFFVDRTDELAHGNEKAHINAEGSTIAGRYKLREQIGEGGMGTVWIAAQQEPVRRLVALKLIKPGLDSKFVLARFEAERQALALMDHPNIAKVLDGGCTEHGRPYFVMEYVKGVPITQYCDEAQLTIRQRLELLLPVCHAVQHAHQKGIIHRDLKPSNILICLYDGRPVPKVIDFGLAKALHQPLTEQSLHTAHGILLGTPLYMSPEQAEFNNLDVDTRTDIYSLGVILYELLTGSTPLAKQRLKIAAYQEIIRLIKEDEPPKPSTRLSGSLSSPSIAAQRKIEPAKLTRLVRGDLDWIVMKALEKDRNRRYETAIGLAEDVQHYLNNDPVQACPPTTWYRFRKTAIRNKGALITGGLIAAALASAVVTLAISNWMIVQERNEKSQALADAKANLDTAERQRKRAERHSSRAFNAVNEMLTLVAQNPLSRFPQMEATRRDLLKQAITMYQGLIQENDPDPSARYETARAFHKIAGVYPMLGQHQEAEVAVGKALEIFEQLVREFPNNIEYRNSLAEVHRTRGPNLRSKSPHAAETHLRRAIELYEQLATEDSQRFRGPLSDAICGLAYHLTIDGTGRHQEAERYFLTALQLREELVAAGTVPVIVLVATCNSFGILLRQTGRPDEAERLHRRALALVDRIPAFSSNSTSSDPRLERARTRIHLAYGLVAQNKREEAIQFALEAVAIFKESADEFPLSTLYLAELVPSYQYLGRTLERAGRHAEALEALQQALKMAENLSAVDPTSGVAERSMVDVLATLIRFRPETGTSVDECFRRLCQLNPKDSLAQNHLAWYLVTLPDPKYRDAGRAVEVAKKSVEQSPKNGLYLNTLGVSRFRAGDYETAIADLEKSRELLNNGQDSFNTFFLAMAHWKLGNKEAARKWYDQAVTWMENHQPKNEELVRFRAEAEEMFKQEPGDSDRDVKNTPN